jgi:hypothetical protein
MSYYSYPNIIGCTVKEDHINGTCRTEGGDEKRTQIFNRRIEGKWPVSRNSRGRKDNIKIEFKDTARENVNRIQALQWWVLVATSSV